MFALDQLKFGRTGLGTRRDAVRLSLGGMAQSKTSLYPIPGLCIIVNTTTLESLSGSSNLLCVCCLNSLTCSHMNIRYGPQWYPNLNNNRCKQGCATMWCSPLRQSLIAGDFAWRCTTLPPPFLDCHAHPTSAPKLQVLLKWWGLPLQPFILRECELLQAATSLSVWTWVKSLPPVFTSSALECETVGYHQLSASQQNSFRLKADPEIPRH